MHRLAKPAFWATGTAGSNPALSAISRARRAPALLLLALALLPACAIERRLELESEDQAGELYLDGRFVGRGRAHVYLPAEGTRRVEVVAEGRIAGRTIAHLDGPGTWTFPLDLVFEALLKMPASWVERVRVAPLPPDLPADAAENEARRAATQQRLRALVHEGAQEP